MAELVPTSWKNNGAISNDRAGSTGNLNMEAQAKNCELLTPGSQPKSCRGVRLIPFTKD